MKILQTIHHKKNELFQVEFFKDKECTEAFDFMDKKDLYIDGLKGDITPLLKLHDNIHTDDVNVCVVNITAPQILQFGKYICGSDEINGQGYGSPQSDTKYYFLNVSDYNDVFEGYAFDNFTNFTPNLSKYIPEDNAVLFLSEEDYNQQRNAVCNFRIKTLNQDFRNVLLFCDGIIQETNTGHINLHYTSTKKITIFLTHGTRSELQKANEVAKELMEKYGVEEVNLFALHCFVHKEHSQNGNPYTNYKPQNGLFKYKRTSATMSSCKYCDTWDIKYECCYDFNKIITTNSTGILPVQDKERLQVIDAKEIFEECGEIVKNNP